MSQEHDDAQRLYHRLNQTRANNGDKLTREEWHRITAEQFKAVRDEERKAAGLRPKRSRGERDPLFDTLATGCGMNLKEMTRTAAKTVGVALGGIRSATPDVTPEEITLRVNTFKRIHATWALTPTTIEKYWPTLGTGRATAQAAANDPRILKGEPKGWREFLEQKARDYSAANDGATADIHGYLGTKPPLTFREFPIRMQEWCWRALDQ